MDRHLLRTIDANTNRLCEGLRVLEDIARFRLDDRDLSEGFRKIRHNVRIRVREDFPRIESCRNTEEDIGKKFAPAANHRKLTEIVRSNARRGQESLRVIEENMRLAHPHRSVLFEKDRYRLYELEKTILSRLSRSIRARGLGVYVLVTEKLCRHSVEETLRRCAAAGAGAVQIREKDMSDADLLAHCEKARKLLSQSETLLIINDRPDIAAAVDADGVHLGQDDLPVSAARTVLGSMAVIGKSTHNAGEAAAAKDECPDYIGAGPVASSPTKPGLTPSGLEYIREAASRFQIPVTAIGGINRNNARAAIKAGADSLAICSAIISSENIEQEITFYRNLIQGDSE